MAALRNKDLILRLAFHLLLAIFLANAANKFFIADLDFELENGFYARIFNFLGDAPDQYRILPLLPLKLLCSYIPFNHAVLLYNLFFAFLVFEMFWWLKGAAAQRDKMLFNLIFAGIYIYTQYTGWRPDTMGLMAAACGAMIAAKAFPIGPIRNFMLLLSILILSFSRADIALIFAIYLAFYELKSWPLRGLLILSPIAVQALLQFALFPDAQYYSETIMLMDNLSGYYFFRNPATYLIFAALIALWKPISTFFSSTFAKYRYFYLLMGAYLLLVLVIGRVNEYRLYLPFVPIFLVIANRETESE